MRSTQKPRNAENRSLGCNRISSNSTLFHLHPPKFGHPVWDLHLTIMVNKTSLRYIIYGLTLLFITNSFSSLGQNINSSNLQLLFEASLQAVGSTKSYVETTDLFGQGFSMGRDLIAQGEGEFKGDKMNGTLSWSKLATRHKGQGYNNTLVAGWIYTDDGAEIMYEARGYAVRIGDENSSKWTYTAALRFEEPDSPYGWLEDIVGVWIGEFDTNLGTAYYRAYIPVN